MSAPFTLLAVALLAQGRVTAEEAAASHAKMQKVLARLAEQADQVDPYTGTAVLEARLAELAALSPEKKPLARFRLLSDVAFHELRLGHAEAAVRHCEEARGLVAGLVDKLTPAEADRAQFDAAIAWMRFGETQNCVARHTGESCIVPIGPSGVHTDQEGSRRAMALLAELLERNPAHHSARWILNIAAMTVGEYPEGVPERHRLPGGFFDSGRDFPRFADVAGERGLDTFAMAGGVVVDDFDGDGVLDIACSAWGLGDELVLFRGQGGGAYEKSSSAGLEGITGGLNLCHADYDDDGDLDLLVMRGAWLGKVGRHPVSLLANDGRGHFRDVSFAAGVAGQDHYPGQGGDWADYDNDGDLDLYLGHETQPGVEAPNQLWRNEGDGTFTDVAAEAGVQNMHFAKSVAWGDVDGDRYPDLFVSNQNGPNRLYMNRRDGTFENAAAAAGVERPLASFPSWFWDYDNDGALDLYVASYWPELGPTAAVYFGGPAKVEGASLYRGDGRGGFRDVAPSMGIDLHAMPMAANYGDVDGDGWLDFYLGTGYPGYDGLVPNLLFVNDRGQRFLDVTTDAGVGHLQKGHGIAFADLDADGDVDLLARLGGAFPGDAFRSALFQNPGFGHRWVEISLVGERSNRFGIGAHLRLDVREGDTRRSIHRWMDSGASFGSNPLRLHVGLGRADALERLEVHWPTSDTRQVFEDVPLDASVVVTEGQAQLRLGRR